MYVCTCTPVQCVRRCKRLSRHESYNKVLVQNLKTENRIMKKF